MRKKAFVLLTGVILILSLVAAAGCGSGNSAQKAKAKEYMEEGDKHISEYESGSGNMMGNRGEMRPPEGGPPAGGPPAEGSYPGDFNREGFAVSGL